MKEAEEMKNWMIALGVAAVVGCAADCAPSAPAACRAGQVVPPAPDEQTRALEAMIRSAMRRNRIVGMGAAVISADQELLCAGYGYADRSRGTPATAGSLFPLGSVTKLFTATAVMQLVEQGTLDLDAPVSRYLTDLGRSGAYAAGPTVRQLLTHHGGLPGNHMEGFELKRPEPTAFRQLPRLLAAEPAACAPDTVFAYSNAGYGLLGCLVEKASGTAYADFVTRGILEPLAMSRTRFFQTEEDGRQSVMGFDGRREVPLYPIRDLPAGALMSSAADMERFMRFIFDHGGHGVLGHAAFAEMTRGQNGNVPLDGEFSIGLGYWLIKPFPVNDLFASHGGDIPPFHALLVTMPERRTGVFLAANSSGAASALIPLAVEMVRSVYAWQTGAPVPEPAPPARFRLDSTARDALPGLYASPLGLVEIRSRRGRLLADLQGLPLELVPRADGVFAPEASVLGLFSIPLPQLRPLRFSFFESDGRRYFRIAALGVLAGLGERFVPGKVPAAWQARAGRYRRVQRDPNASCLWPRNVSLGWDQRRGLLLAYEVPGLRGTFPLEVRDDGRAVIRGKGTGLGETITARHEGGAILLEWSGMLLEKE
jgi:CubicO group peptidase (beta-lactamase class C family)